MAKHWQVSFLEHYHAKREKEHKREEKRKKGKRYQDVRFPEYHHTKKKKASAGQLLRILSRKKEKRKSAVRQNAGSQIGPKSHKG